MSRQDAWLRRKVLNDSSQNQFCEALTEVARARVVPPKRKKLAGVRVSPGGYFVTAAILTFVSLLLLRTHRDLAALVLIAGTWTILPLLLITDRLNFDGRILSRSGLLALLSRLVRGAPPCIGVEDIEHIEVRTLRTLRRGGSVRYRYRVEVTGNEQTFIFASGSENFRQMARILLPRVSDHKLDARARELRDYLTDAKAIRAEVTRLDIGPVSMLEQTNEATRKKIDKHRRVILAQEPVESERASLLRKAANDLRVAGRLRESAEAFRRALLISPQDPWLIYEYARLLRSQASAFGDARLLARAGAALRLAERRSADDARLLERIGESFLEYGDPARAAKSFRHALQLEEGSYRAQLGLAEVALTEGKLAHVIHHYNDAARIAPDKATAHLARCEADYYARLNHDEDYLAAELRRMNWLEGANRVHTLAARISFAALFVALLGPSVAQVVAGLGWALASSSIIAWFLSLILRKLLAARRRAEASDL
jgi:tetratricopeptide (TPR) repeat protein